VTTHIALLRAVNVGGRNLVAMADLRALLKHLGLSDPRSLLQSGNLVFGSPARPAQLETMLDTEAKRRLGLEATFFVRSAPEWQTVIARNPFPREARRDPGRLIVLFLRAAPKAASVAALRAAISGREIIETNGRHAYIVYPDGQGTSRLTVALIERKLGVQGTGRNWNTVTKLAALAAG